MSVTATITIEAEDQEHLGAILSAIGAALGQRPGRDDARVPDVRRLPADELTSWYRLNGARFVAKLQPNARKALRLIATFPDETVPVAVVASGIGKQGTALAGSLASIGAATRALEAPGPPFERDAKRKQYRMSPSLRAVFSDLLSDEPAAGDPDD